LKFKIFSFINIFIVLALALSVFGSVSATPTSADDLPDVAANTDNPSHPLGDQQSALMLKGLDAKLNGKTDGPVKEVAKGQFVELEREGEDSIWTVLGQFSDFSMNQIPEPDRSVDNSTIWAPDFSRDYYLDLLFSETPGDISMRNFYIEQSANRYTVNGDVTDWVTVPGSGNYYGSNYCGGIVCARTWLFVRDAVNAWYNDQVAAGKTPAEIDAYLSQFDVWDRYDYDSDGNFNEPDGYIDHFQAVHAGEGEETGGGALGSNAIWSHRWYAFYNYIGLTGPSPDNLQGGIKIGGTNFWIGDYTVEPENGGVGVFAHEYGHDLGLPDLYDTSGNTGGAENSVGFWSLYSSGSYGSTGIASEGIGSKPIPMSAYEKIFLGWSNYEVVGYQQKVSTKLGPANENTKQAQQLVALLPDKELSSYVGDPFDGSFMYFSGSGNDLDNSMTRDVTLPTGVVSFSAKVNYDIETDWDYAYLTVNGVSVETNLSTNTNPFGQNFGYGITDWSGGNWVDLTADLSAFAGQTVTIGFRYWTDGAVAYDGMLIDNVEITGSPLDGAENDEGWSFDGFVRTTDTITKSFFNAYFAEFRTYRGYDDGLRTGPYNFGFTNNPSLGNWVEHFPYQDGLLVWYYDTSFADNNVGDNCASGRCGGLFLPVDAHPALLLRPDNGKVWRPRVQSFDSTFGLDKTDVVCLHMNSVESCFGGLPANKVFDDTQSYWVAPDSSISNFGWASVPVPNTGTKIRVVSVSAQGNFMQIQVNK
jgi:immune inhibitor A